jgi:hypothetical protein
MADALTFTPYYGVRNINVTLADVSDGTGLTNYVFLNGSLCVKNPLGHLKVKRIKYSITNMVVTLTWGGGTPATLAYLGQGEDIIDWSNSYSAGLPNAAGTPNGNILISATTINSATAGFVISLDCIAGV